MAATHLLAQINRQIWAVHPLKAQQYGGRSGLRQLRRAETDTCASGGFIRYKSRAYGTHEKILPTLSHDGIDSLRNFLPE